MRERIRIGLGRDYHEIENEVYGIRGRIDFDKSIKSMCFPQGRTYSRYQVYTQNVKKNQMIKSTLYRMMLQSELTAEKKFEIELKNKIHSIFHELNGVDLIDLKPTEILREQLKQKDMDYSLMLALCYLLCLQYMPTEKKGKFSLIKIKRGELTLHDIFEKFVSAFYRYHLLDWNVKPQSIVYWPVAESHEFLPVMKPDIIFENKKTKQIIILDTKFTKKSIVEGQWKNLTFNRDHLFQIYSYLRTQEDISEFHAKSTGLLLYPTITNPVSHSRDIQGHKIIWESINLAQPWQQIEKDLIAIILKIKEN
jgi:5-methylcytosine-specific restriction enzyme subunit McrC